MGGVPSAAQEEKIHKEAGRNNVGRKPSEVQRGRDGAELPSAGREGNKTQQSPGQGEKGAESVGGLKNTAQGEKATAGGMWWNICMV